MSLTAGQVFDGRFTRGDSAYYTFLERYGTLRVGARHRIGEHVSLGGGLGGNVEHGRDDCDDCSSPSPFTRGAFTLDLELSAGGAWRHLALSFTQRVVWEATSLIAFHLVSDFTVAWILPGGRWAMTGSLYFGLSGYIPWGGAGVGLAVLL